MKEAKELEKAAKKAAKEKEKNATARVATSVSVMEDGNKGTRRETKRQAQKGGNSAKKMKKDNLVFSDIYCVCLGNYDDADAGTNSQWLQRKCLRWIHEDCIDYEDSSSNESLPFVLNKLP